MSEASKLENDELVDTNRLSIHNFTGNGKEIFSTYKSKYENTYNHNSKGRRSSEVIPHQIVAVIQLRGGSDILEIPLLTLSSPFTLIYSRKGVEPGGTGNQEFVFPELAALVNTFRDDKGNYTEEKHIVLQKVLAQE